MTARQRLRRLGGNIAKFARTNKVNVGYFAAAGIATAIGVAGAAPHLAELFGSSMTSNEAANLGAFSGAAVAAAGGMSRSFDWLLKKGEDMGTKNPAAIFDKAGRTSDPEGFINKVMSKMTNGERVLMKQFATGEEAWSKHHEPEYHSQKNIKRGVQVYMQMNQEGPSQSASLSMS